MTEMDIYLTQQRNPYSVYFSANFDPPTTCQPYAFYCKTSLNNIFRLPEEDSYYFGTEWMDWSFTNITDDYGYSCKENHYYYNDDGEWIVNGGPTLNTSDIWYYNEGNECEGCQFIDILDCWGLNVYYPMQLQLIVNVHPLHRHQHR